MNLEPLRELERVAQEMRERRVNHGKSVSPTLIAWADRITAIIAALGEGQEAGAVALEPTPMAESRFGGQEPAFRMDAYYYGFAHTGIAVIDIILSAVACAGKAYHSTECWNDESSPWHERLRGNSPAEWIQRAADDAASEIRKMTSPAHTSDARDAARYRWLRQFDVDSYVANGSRERLDAAIDAAMRQEAGDV